MPYTIFGKMECVEPKENECSACGLKASALQTTFLLNNNEFQFDSASQWELNVLIRNLKTFNKVIGDYNTELPEGLTYNQDLFKVLNETYSNYTAKGFKYVPFKIDFLSERSIPDNIEEEANQNASIIVVSYILMFVYVSIAIGFFPSKVHSRFILGASGIVVVIFALIMAIGITFYMKVPLTMISAEVVPFLILAIGVDNMFLISRAERTVPAHVKDVDLRIAYAMKEVGPSIFAAAFCEALAFFIGMLTDVPALYSFCLVAGLSVIADFVLQITLFLAALSLDGKRIQQNRADIFFCVKVNKKETPRKEWIRSLFGEYFVPLVFHKLSQIVIFAIAVCLLIISFMSCSKIKLGLN
jgi:Niemann-Pick C1 protein